MINKQVYLTSMIRAINKSKKVGMLDLTVVQLFDLVNYYVTFTDGDSNFNEEHVALKKLLAKLKYRYTEDLCTYKTLITNKQVNLGGSGGIQYNSPPSVSDNTIYIYQSNTYKFKNEDFLLNFQDPNGNSYAKVKIEFDLLEGELYHGGTNIGNSTKIVDNTIELDLRSDLKLYYKRPDNDLDLTDELKFRVTDNDIYPLYSSRRNLYIEREIITNGDNLPPTIGDIEIIRPNRHTNVININMLTTLLQPPYNDPEGDLIDAIRIDAISIANKGKYLYNGIEVTPGDIISREDVIAGLFIHKGPDIDTASSDIFLFSARDEGSGIWVQ